MLKSSPRAVGKFATNRQEGATRRWLPDPTGMARPRDSPESCRCAECGDAAPRCLGLRAGLYHFRPSLCQDCGSRLRGTAKMDPNHATLRGK